MRQAHETGEAEGRDGRRRRRATQAKTRDRGSAVGQGQGGRPVSREGGRGTLREEKETCAQAAAAAAAKKGAARAAQRYVGQASCVAQATGGVWGFEKQRYSGGVQGGRQGAS